MVSNELTGSSPTRQRIRDYVYAHPGVHFRALVRDLGLATGQVQYHVRRLIKSRDLYSTRLYGRTHYFPPEYDEWERGVLALARRETAREIVFFLLERGPARPGAVVLELDIARSTLEWQLDRLIEQEIVEKRRSQRNQVTLALVHPNRTIKLLSRVTPTVPDRLADRFLRFVDHLFDGDGWNIQ